MTAHTFPEEEKVTKHAIRQRWKLTTLNKSIFTTNHSQIYYGIWVYGRFNMSQDNYK